jgi:hypothetical protein
MADRFLVVVQKKVIDTPADPTATPPVAEVSHQELEHVYVEDSAAQVAINLELPVPNMEAYLIKFSGPNLVATLKPVNVKAGARAPGTVKEIVEIEAAGEGVVGSAEVTV